MFKLKENPVHPDYYKYPSSDGEPMAETTLHFRWIVTIKENLEILTMDQDIFVAGDLLWYPVQGNAKICKAPDVMVAFGRPRGDRLSYLQWHEDDTPPKVVFEILSKSNHRRRNKENLLEFYEKYGVEEYYSYDPVQNTFVIYLFEGNKLTNRLEDPHKWVSPLLNIRFERSEAGFQIYHPDGQQFAGFEELERRNRDLTQQFEDMRELRRQERKRFMMVEKQAEAAEQKAEDERQKAEAAEQRAETAEQRAETAEKSGIGKAKSGIGKAKS